MPDLHSLGRLAEQEFFDIVQSAATIENKLRITLIDGSYIDFWWSEEIQGRYAYHWQRSSVDGTIYRHDNIPHLRWQSVESFPKHFHFGSQRDVVDSDISETPEHGLRQFLEFAKGILS